MERDTEAAEGQEQEPFTGWQIQTLARLIRISRQRGSAIGIAHPFSSTYRVFKRSLPGYRERGITFVTVSELLAN